MARGWLLLLGAFLMLWEPMRVAGELQDSLGTLAMRGAGGVIELVTHAGVAALAVAAGWALWSGNPAARGFAIAALAASAAVSVQASYWSALPHQTMPGERLPMALLAVAHAAAWIVYLKRSRRAQATFR